MIYTPSADGSSWEFRDHCSCECAKLFFPLRPFVALPQVPRSRRWSPKVSFCMFADENLKTNGLTHSGDFTSAPHPEGARELVDVNVLQLRNFWSAGNTVPVFVAIVTFSVRVARSPPFSSSLFRLHCLRLRCCCEQDPRRA